MDRIRLAVHVRNETNLELRLVSATLDHGDWTNPWQPPLMIRDEGEFRAEGNLLLAPTTGTEGRVEYQVGGDPNCRLYIHFDSPLVESQYGNTFHVWAPQGFDVQTHGGQGHDARLDVALRVSSRHRVRNFLPSIRGLHFSNKWSADLPVTTVGAVFNRLLEQLPGVAEDALSILRMDEDALPITHADAGLCGGMVYAVMDYYHAGLFPPPLTSAPVSPDDPIFRYVRDRLIDSFDIFGGGHRYLAYSSPLYPNGDKGFVQAAGLWRGRSWVSYRDEWPKIRDDIDHNRLSPVALIQTDSLAIGRNHQVAGYAYQQNGQKVQLWVYDPNHPGNNNDILEFDITDTSGEVHVTRSVPSNERIYCFFRTDNYTPKPSPGGRGHEAITVNDAMHLVTEHRQGVLPSSVPGMTRPTSLRQFVRSI
ncbi:hypothetical protein [Dactylosporangium sp. NPDC048998]|uniref:hypothetical protein n=1 Tax=Dactylosporangium sp. NPDC048998 TaxID=3363976 RepID=UPI003711299E